MNGKIGSVVTVTTIKGNRVTGTYGGMQSVNIRGKKIMSVMVGGQAIAFRSVRKMKKVAA